MARKIESQEFTNDLAAAYRTLRRIQTLDNANSEVIGHLLEVIKFLETQMIGEKHAG